MNTFSNMEINDLLDNRFRLDDAKDGGVPRSAWMRESGQAYPQLFGGMFPEAFPYFGQDGPIHGG